ncbi:MAG: hypothetical protein M0Z47_07565 [Actinomycetota bacterium]|nr:hypothetical protein [Actinomycetota bacterium]
MRSLTHKGRRMARMTAWALVAGANVVVRPSMWGIAVAQLFAFARRDWYARPPYLPVPDMRYLRFRMETLYGTGDAMPPTRDLLEYLRWCRTQRQLWL